MSAEDLTLRELRQASEIMTTLFTSAAQHTLEHLGDEGHECTVNTDDLDDIEIFDFDDFDVRVFLAFEETFVNQMTFIRAAMRKQGYHVTRTVGT